ncbi:50S ribosomal protein L3 [Candidatus Phytoplasma melaleucae]|uniref:Large ribosomal subunit protein uL3 n=1 Tax=Candidatus Phytoplasma melaleucae TaxID=2982630 RepID=A0ABT9DEP2_9MOLU|nr:50S ribosomal protein L3 ['Melaleuca sp.' phytoplasma]MDO8168127.1 50S ribosomal protein L3 ['Melaleuca sp.' phytoplasma]MDV3205245.1 50S ribosomal protein L3 [Weeping tea tree witches'-broom phytoplasma]
MSKGILGKKIGMTQYFDEQGFCIPVTVVYVADNVVIQQKTTEKDGYQATQLGFATKKEKLTKKPLKGHFQKAKSIPKSFLKEISFAENIKNELTDLNIGQILDSKIFFSGEFVDVTSVSKGKGFAGTIKKYNQSVGPNSHGSRFHRRPGSNGPIKGNQKGKHLPGQMGFRKTTIQNLKIVSIVPDKNLFLIKGSVPGPKSSFLTIRSSVKKITREGSNVKV